MSTPLPPPAPPEPTLPEPAPPENSEAFLSHFPLFLKVQDRPVVVLGSTEMARAKADLLRRAGARVELCSTLSPEQIAARRPVMVIDARLCEGSSGEDDSRQLWDVCRSHGILLNTVDRPAFCDFIVPALVERGPVIVAISTGGAAPALAGRLRQRIEQVLPQGLAALVQAAARCRDRVKAQFPTFTQRQAFWAGVYAEERLEALAQRVATAESREEADAIVVERLSEGQRRALPPLDSPTKGLGPLEPNHFRAE